MKQLTHLARHAAVAAALLAPALSFAQTDYPSRPIRLVVTVPPGGAADFVARQVGSKLSDALGQPVLIDNRAGASGTIAADYVAKQPADGYTLFQNSITTHGIGPHLYTKLPYDPVRDFASVGMLARLPLVMTVNASVPANDVKALVALAKQKPGTLAFASSGSGGSPHMAGELFALATGTQLVHVPYKGSGPAVADLVSGQVQIMFDGAPSLIGFVRTGKLRALAAASAERNRLLPDVPTFAEMGYRGMEVSLWYGLMVAAATPRPIVTRLNAELQKILTSPDIRERFASQGADPMPGTPEQFAQFMRDEMTRWGEVVKKANIKGE